MTVTDDVERVAQCANCGRTFTPARSDAAYCGARCRQAAYRARVEASKPKPKREPLPKTLDRAEWRVRTSVEQITKRVTDLVDVPEDDRFSRLARSGKIDTSRMARMAAEQAGRLREQAGRLDALADRLR